MFRLIALFAVLALPASAQTNIDLGGLTVDSAAQVEVSADSLSVDQATGTAQFTGNVIVGQGDLRMSAGSIRVVYDDATGAIAQLLASGGVTFVTASEAAEADNADYNLTDGVLILSGNVLLTQGPSALSADRMTINLEDGSAFMDGRVRTVFNQGNN